MRMDSPEYRELLANQVRIAAAAPQPLTQDHRPIPHVRTVRPNGSIPPHPLHAVDCSCGYASGGEGIWYGTETRAREVWERHEIHPSVRDRLAS